MFDEKNPLIYSLLEKKEKGVQDVQEFLIKMEHKHYKDWTD